MRTPFVPSSLNGGPMTAAIASPYLPAFMTVQRTNTINSIAAVLQAQAGLSQAQAVGLATGIVDDLRTPRPEMANIATDLRNLGSATTLDPASVVDIEPLKATFNNTYELGYKGLAGGRLSFDVAAWYQSRGDVATPASIATPGVTLDSTTLHAYMQPRIRAALEANGFPAASAAALATGLAGGISNSYEIAPLGTVTFNNARLAPGADVLATYRILDAEVELWGADMALDFALTDAVSLAGTYGYASKVVFEDVTVGNGPFSLNAPGHKASLTARYASPVRRLGGEIRGRYTDGFPVNSGVYSSYGQFPSPNVGGAPYSYSTVPVNMLMDIGANYRFSLAGRNALWSVNVTNVLNNERATFAGVPEIGRMAITRLQYSF
jgi:iron complex outermembrane receptor protein